MHDQGATLANEQSNYNYFETILNVDYVQLSCCGIKRKPEVPSSPFYTSTGGSDQNCHPSADGNISRCK